MKYRKRKQSKKKVSPVVLRAIARINDHENKKVHHSNTWHQQLNNYLLITS